jgi:hypothetical protein
VVPVPKVAISLRIVAPTILPSFAPPLVSTNGLI